MPSLLTFGAIGPAALTHRTRVRGASTLSRRDKLKIRSLQTQVNYLEKLTTKQQKLVLQNDKELFRGLGWLAGLAGLGIVLPDGLLTFLMGCGMALGGFTALFASKDLFSALEQHLKNRK